MKMMDYVLDGVGEEALDVEELEDSELDPVLELPELPELEPELDPESELPTKAATGGPGKVYVIGGL